MSSRVGAPTKETVQPVLDAVPTALVLVNAEGRIVLVNTQFERTFGYSRDDLLEQSATTLVPERFHAPFQEKLKIFFATP